eukprot:scaffold112701_cov78-Phaeocystis_antarctica.AAC.1
MRVQTEPWPALLASASLSALAPGCCRLPDAPWLWPGSGKGGKNRRRGKNDSESKRELTFKEDGQGGLL